MYTVFIIALVLLPSRTAATVTECPGEKHTANSQCYTCPQFESLPTKIVWGVTWAKEDVGETCYAQEDSDSFRCQYKSTHFYDHHNKKTLPPNYLGRCRYDRNGRKGHDSRDQCPRHAPKDKDCLAVKKQTDNKGHYLKKCGEKGCEYETETCHTCPAQSGTQSVSIDTRNNKLQCGYYKNSALLHTCQYNPVDGKVISNGQTCIGTATVDITCKENRDRRIRDDQYRAHAKAAAAAKAAKEKAIQEVNKKYDDNKSPLTFICEGIIERLLEGDNWKDFWIKQRRLGVGICRDPETALDKLDINNGEFKDFVRFDGRSKKVREALLKAGFKPSAKTA